MKRIPITVLTGFLGSGKTTLINKILTQAQKEGLKIAIIENELGSIGIDKNLITAGAPLGSIQGENIIQVAQGCVCCTVRGDLAPALRELIQSGIEIDHIILETTGIADPLPIMQTIVTDPSVRLQFELCNVVTVIDAVNYSHTQEISQTNSRQIALADIVYISKLDGVLPKVQSEVEEYIAHKNPYALKIVSNSSLEIARLFESSSQALSRVSFAQTIGVSDIERKHDTEISTHILRSEKPLRNARTHAWLTSISHALEQNLLRIKGFIYTNDGMYMVNCVRDSVVYELVDKSVANGHANTELVIVAYKLNKEMLTIIEQGFNDLDEK